MVYPLLERKCVYFILSLDMLTHRIFDFHTHNFSEKEIQFAMSLLCILNWWPWLVSFHPRKHPQLSLHLSFSVSSVHYKSLMKHPFINEAFPATPCITPKLIAFPRHLFCSPFLHVLLLSSKHLDLPDLLHIHQYISVLF